MGRIRGHLAPAGVVGVLAVCCGAHLLVIAAAVGGIGAGLLGPALLAPELGLVAVIGLVGATALLARRLLRVHSGATRAECCDVHQRVRPSHIKDVSTP